MKAKKTFLVVILCVIGLSSFAGEIFWTGAGLGFIKANSIRFFPGKGTSWVHSPDYDFVIPADTKKIFHAAYTLPYEIQLLSLMPQANLFCRSWEVYAILPGQRAPLKLLKINDWNINWKQTYYLTDPLILPKGTVLHALNLVIQDYQLLTVQVATLQTLPLKK